MPYLLLKKLDKFWLLLPFIIFFVQSLFLIYKNPPIWPDEAIYADIAANWLEEGRLGPDIWLDAYPGATQHFYSYPPFFLLLTATYIKLFGVSVLAQRLLPQTAAILFLITFFLIIKTLFKNQKNSLLAIPIIALVLDPFFSQASRIARPEMIVTMIGSLGFLAFIKSENSKYSTTRHLLAVICGVLTSFAFLTHFFGGTIFTLCILLSFLFLDKFSLIKSKNFYLFILSFLAAPSLYFLSIFPNWTIFKYQLLLYAKTVSDYQYSVLRPFSTDNILPQILIVAYVLTSVVFIVKTIKNKSRQLVPLLTILGISWLAVIYGKEDWYFFYVTPWIYLAASFLLIEFFRKYFINFLKLQKGKYFHLLAIEGPIILIGLMFFAGLFSTLQLIWETRPNKYSYQLFVNRVLDVVPENKTVYLSSIPDPYFGFKSQGRTNTLYEFPVVPIEKERFLKLLDNSDYIVFTAIYSRGNSSLLAYINKNTQKTILIGSEDQYQAQVFELKPKDQRQRP